MSETATKETMEFQTEVRQLLDLMIHSLYSNKEIFLRELISNASDALDKQRFDALSQPALNEGNAELKVRIEIDKDANTLTISDSGIGMTRQEVIDNIGTIANSGTRKYLEALKADQASESNLIGQFGVGFYASFMVADKITLTTRRAGSDTSEGVCWVSTGEGGYELESVEKAERGTSITLHLKDDEGEFLTGYRVRGIISRYSDHISFPVEMRQEVPPPPPPSAEGEEEKAEEETPKPEDQPFEVVNTAKALWMRSRQEITKEEYHEFYKHQSHDYEEPLSYIHNHIEGKTEYTLLLFVPKHAPYDLWSKDRKSGVKLYVRRVFILEDSDQLMPNYLRFIRGVIDTNDLPLNVSREILQHNKAIDSIRSGAVKKVLGLLESMSKNDKDLYATLWKEFGAVLKEGIIEDYGNKEKVAKLLRFSSTHTDNITPDVSLDDYIARMPEEQEKIYFITAKSFAAAKGSPQLEIFRKKNIEVLLLHERVDEWMSSNLHDYDGKSLQSVAKGELDLGKLGEDSDEEKAAAEKASVDYQSLIDSIKNVLGEQVKEVRITQRLQNSPACLVSDESGMGLNMERILQSAGQEVAGSQPILEINPNHLMVKRLKDEQDGERMSDWAKILFDQAMLSEGGQLDDPAAFVHRLNDMLMVLTGSVSSEASPAKEAVSEEVEVLEGEVVDEYTSKS
jgi:molecular chaperone HtpG